MTSLERSKVLLIKTTYYCILSEILVEGRKSCFCKCCCLNIHRMHKWLPINYSFIFVLISLSSLISMQKVQKNFHTKMRLVSLISIYYKRIIIQPPFMHSVYRILELP